MAAPLINGVGYGWASIKFTALGRTFVGITAVNFKDAQVIEGNYGQGNQYIEVVFGNITNEGSVTLKAYELDELAKIAPGGRVQNIPPFTVVITFTAGTKVQVILLENVIIKENGRDNSQGDTTSEFQCPLFIGNIKFNG